MSTYSFRKLFIMLNITLIQENTSNIFVLDLAIKITNQLDLSLTLPSYEPQIYTIATLKYFISSSVL